MADKYTAETIIRALRLSGGVIAEAARSLRCSRHTMYRYIRTYPTVKRAYEEETENCIDQAEASLIDFVRGTIGGQSTRERLDAIKFYLRTKGRGRGYGDRLDVLVEQGMEREMETVFDTLARILPEELYTQVIYELSTDSTAGSGAKA